MRLLSYSRKGEKSSYDTFGGTQDATDRCSKDCLVRELQEEVSTMPGGWQRLIDEATTAYPDGHNTYYSIKWQKQESHYTTVWFVQVPDMKDTPGTSPQFAREECTSDSLAWRKAADVLVNLNQYVFHQSLVLIIQGAKRQHQANQRQKRRPRVQRPGQLEAPRKGIIVVCAGLGVMADSCVERGFANIIATCDGNDLCRQLLQTRHPSANHYGDLKEVAEEVWAKYRWDQAHPSETAYILMGELPFASDSEQGRRGRHMVQVAQILQSPLVIVESAPRFIQSES